MGHWTEQIRTVAVYARINGKRCLVGGVLRRRHSYSGTDLTSNPIRTTIRSLTTTEVIAD